MAVGGIAVSVLLAGCGVFVADRYRYSCGLSDRDLVQYKEAFTSAFPNYPSGEAVDSCGDGSMRGFRMELGSGMVVPSEARFNAGGCSRIADPDSLDQAVYLCVSGRLRYEITLEDSSIYLAPMST